MYSQFKYDQLSFYKLVLNPFILGPNEYLVVRKFQNITKVKFIEAAVYVLQVNGWDLDRAIRWYHDHRNNNCNMSPDLKFYLYNDGNEERPGIYLSSCLLFMNAHFTILLIKNHIIY